MISLNLEIKQNHAAYAAEQRILDSVSGSPDILTLSTFLTPRLGCYGLMSYVRVMLRIFKRRASLRCKRSCKREEYTYFGKPHAFVTLVAAYVTVLALTVHPNP